ncbi:Tn7-like element transposition protein TnsE [Moraxella canis]|uniref:Tn7-like element transposition protein TnsE n=1 Tax=Moraxella canis TaxID=90239 RepID=UPI00066716E6|nr:Tn7-like element transposition protein TnsE [Moraxella canis]
MNFNNLPENSLVTQIDNVIKKKNSWKEWYLGLNYRPCFNATNDESFTRLRFSNAPILAVGRILNRTIDNSDFIQKTLLLNDLNLSNYNKNNEGRTHNQKYYDFDSFVELNNITKLIKVRIPKLELARVLFFHNAYLALSSLEERAFERDFSIDEFDDKYTISVLPYCSIPKASFASSSFRSYLSWILLNPMIRQSYESIYKNFNLNKSQDGVWYKWNFDFEPPSLQNFTIQVRGVFSQQDTFCVHEITGLRQLESGITKPIEFHGDIFVEENISVSKVGKDKGVSSNDKFITINEIENANSDLKPQIIDTPKVTFEFLKPISSIIKPKKVVNKSVIKSTSANNNTEMDGFITTVATGEATILGTVRKGEFDNTDDKSNKDSLYRQNFETLLNSLKRLNLEDFSDDYLKLPYVPRCRLYMKSNGNERNILQAKFSFNGQKFALFEIDTSDYVRKKKRVSTLIVALDDENFERAPLDFLQGIVKKSLGWPTINFGRKVNLSHPKDFYNTTSDDEAMIDNWAQRIEIALNQL